MAAAMRTALRVRLAAILAVGAFALHQLRYLLAFGASSSAHLAADGHRYMAGALPPIAVLVLAAAVATLIRGTEGASPARAHLGGRIAMFTATLFAIYAGQESLEGLVAAGHPEGPAAVLGGGGWLALPLALAIGAVAALLARALERVERVIAVAHPQRGRRRAPAIRGRALRLRGPRLASMPLAFGLARRPPPGAPA